MRLPALSRRVLLGGVVAASLVGTAALSTSFAADPTLGCSFADEEGDSGLGGGAPMTGDDDLDITRVGFLSSGGVLTASIKVVDLKTGPDNYPGDDFDVAFTYNGKVFLAGGDRPLTSDPTTYLLLDGDDVTAMAPSLKVAFDEAKDIVEVSLSLADLAKVGGAPVDGKSLSGLRARSFAYVVSAGVVVEEVTDTATPTPATATYLLGSAACTGAAPAPSGTPSASGSPSASGTPSATASTTPSASASSSSTATATATSTASPSAGTTIVLSGPTRVQFSDPFATLVTLRDAAGNPLSGKRVTAKHGGAAAVAGTTNSSGQVRLTTPVRERSATRNLVVSFAGDASAPARSVTRAITTVNEVTRLRKTVSGSGSTRTVTVQLVEDDPTTKVLAGRRILFQYSGTSVTLTTDSSGRAKVTAKTGAAMDITFTGETGTYAQAKIRTYAK